MQDEEWQYVGGRTVQLEMAGPAPFGRARLRHGLLDAF